MQVSNISFNANRKTNKNKTLQKIIFAPLIISMATRPIPPNFNLDPNRDTFQYIEKKPDTNSDQESLTDEKYIPSIPIKISLPPYISQTPEEIMQEKIEEAQKKREEEIAQTKKTSFLNLSKYQEKTLNTFVKRYKENYDAYKAVFDATGVPPELIAAEHFREAGGNLNRDLASGDPIDPNNWVNEAIKTMSVNYMQKFVPKDYNDLSQWLEHAERHNGLANRDCGRPSSYIFSGTHFYTKGKYTFDGYFDPNHVDQQLGIVVMLHKIKPEIFSKNPNEDIKRYLSENCNIKTEYEFTPDYKNVEVTFES